MIKKFYQITIRDYNTIEQSGSVSHLAKWYVPVFLFRKLILSEVEKANKILNAKDGDDETDNLKWRVMSMSKINGIQASVMGLFNLLNLGGQILVFKDELIRKDRRKIKVTVGNAERYISNIKELTGIEVKVYEDLGRVVKELEFRKDKYAENFNKPSTITGKAFLMQIVLGVFSYLNQPVNLEMTISEFAIMRDEANEKLRREKN